MGFMTGDVPIARVPTLDVPIARVPTLMWLEIQICRQMLFLTNTHTHTHTLVIPPKMGHMKTGIYTILIHQATGDNYSRTSIRDNLVIYQLWHYSIPIWDHLHKLADRDGTLPIFVCMRDLNVGCHPNVPHWELRVYKCTHIHTHTHTHTLYCLYCWDISDVDVNVLRGKNTFMK